MTRTLARSVGTFRTRDVPSDPSWAGESRMRHDEEPDIEIHNHIPTDYGALTSEQMDSDRARHRDEEPDEEPDEEDEFVELLPPDHFARQTEDGRTAIYRRRHGDSRHVHNAEHENLAFDRRRKHVARDQRRPPESLAELNDLHRQFYAKSHAVR